MSIIILGGCGEMGRFMAMDLVKSGFDVTIADINEVLGQQLAKNLGTRASFKKLNIREFDTLVEVLKDYKITINNIGPYFEFRDWIPRAALQAGINYIDICDDFDTTEMILNMHDRVEREGLVFRTGFGSSPGITNIMTIVGTRKLEKVKSVRVIWLMDTGETIGLGQLMHWCHIGMGKVPQYLNGKTQWVQALSEREIIRLPEPIGRAALYYTGHPEPVSIPRYIEAEEVVCKGGVKPESNIDITRAIGKQLTYPLKHPIIIKLISKLVLKIMPLFTGNVEERKVGAANRVEVIGKQQHQNIRLIYEISAPAGPKTATPTSITSQMMINREIVTPGVYPPEGCPDLDVDKFIKELAKRNIRFSEERELMKKVPA